MSNELIKVTVSQNGKIIKSQHNEYNANGKRISKTDNGTKTYYYYEGDNLIYTTDANGNKTSQNIYGIENNVIAGIRYEGTGQHAYFYSKDIKGSTSVITDEKGSFVTRYSYTDFGETTKFGRAEFYNEICYTGGIYDELTGLYYLNARYYNPDSAVFISQDSYRGEPDNYQTWNLYAYCAGNPIKYVDPSGHWVETAADVASLTHSSYTYSKDHSVWNGTMLVWDTAAVAVPVMPGSYVAKGGKAVVKKVGKKVLTAAKKTKVVKKIGKVAKAGKSKIVKAGKAVGKKVGKLKNKVKKFLKSEKGSVSKGAVKVKSKTVNDILSTSVENTTKKGIAKNYIKSGGGGYKQVLKDFDSLDLTNIKTIDTKGGIGKVGTLKDGTKVIARPGSKTGGATLEIQISNSKKYKIRY